MEATIVCWGSIGIMENKMEAAIVSLGYIGRIREPRSRHYSMVATCLWLTEDS